MIVVDVWSPKFGSVLTRWMTILCVPTGSAFEDAGRLRRETRQAERGRAAEVWIPVLAPAA